jgi:hypothetical protein
VDVKNSVTKNGRTSTFLICDFILSGDVTKRATLNIRSVKAGPPPGQAAASPGGTIANPASGSTLVSEKPATTTTAVTASENPTAGSGENPMAASQNLAAVTANWTDIRTGGSRTETENAAEASEDDAAVAEINRNLARADDSAEFIQTLIDNLQREEAIQMSKLEAAAMANVSTAAETMTKTMTATLASEAGTATAGIAMGTNEDMAQLRNRNRNKNSRTSRTAATVPATATAQATVPVTAAAQATAQAPIQPVAVAHGVEWYSDHRGNTKPPIQGVVPAKVVGSEDICR